MDRQEAIARGLIRPAAARVACADGDPTPASRIDQPTLRAHTTETVSAPAAPPPPGARGEAQRLRGPVVEETLLGKARTKNGLVYEFIETRWRGDDGALHDKFTLRTRRPDRTTQPHDTSLAAMFLPELRKALDAFEARAGERRRRR